MADERTPGQVAYEAWIEATNKRFPGYTNLMLKWEHFDHRAEWEATARAVIGHYLARQRDLTPTEEIRREP